MKRVVDWVSAKVLDKIFATIISGGGGVIAYFSPIIQHTGILLAIFIGATFGLLLFDVIKRLFFAEKNNDNTPVTYDLPETSVKLKLLGKHHSMLTEERNIKVHDIQEKRWQVMNVEEQVVFTGIIIAKISVNKKLPDNNYSISITNGTKIRMRFYALRDNGFFLLVFDRYEIEKIDEFLITFNKP